MRIMLLIMALIAASYALSVGPMIYEQKDMGDPGLPEFLYSMSADCTAATVTTTVMDDNFTTIPDADVYLEYTQFSSQTISSTQSDADGVAVSKLPGSVKLMQGLFIMVIEKYGYRNKEIHFDLSPCVNGTAIPPKPVAPKNQTNQTTPKNQTVQSYNASKNPVSTNTSQNISGNVTVSGTQNSICPSAMLVAALAFVGGLIAYKKKPSKRWRKR